MYEHRTGRVTDLTGMVVNSYSFKLSLFIEKQFVCKKDEYCHCSLGGGSIAISED